MTIPISTKEIEQKTLELLQKRGFSKADAQTICGPILWAVTHGNNQGLLKLVNEAALQKDTSIRPITIVRETKCSAWIDGGEHNAMLVVQRAVDKAKELIKTCGMAVVGTRGTHSSCGALAYFTEQVAAYGCIAIIMSRTPPTVAPFGSIEPLFGTNPLAISYPTMEGPITFDMATAAIAWYGLLEAAAKGEDVDSTLVINALGQPTSDPSVVMKKGSILPFDRGHKGAGLGMMVELLAGPLIGAAFADLEGDWGNLLIVIDPDLFVGKSQFKESSSALLKKLKQAKTVDGQSIRLPGERAGNFNKQVRQTDSIEVSEKILAKLNW